MELEAKAELASAKLRRTAIASAPSVSRASVDAYYARHARQFTVPELREVWITNRKSAAAGDQVIREIESGRSVTALLEREVFVWHSSASLHNPYKTLERAIHAASLHALSGPVKQRVDYFVFKVRRSPVDPSGAHAGRGRDQTTPDARSSAARTSCVRRGMESQVGCPRRPTAAADTWCRNARNTRAPGPAKTRSSSTDGGSPFGACACRGSRRCSYPRAVAMLATLS